MVVHRSSCVGVHVAASCVVVEIILILATPFCVILLSCSREAAAPSPHLCPPTTPLLFLSKDLLEA